MPDRRSAFSSLVPFSLYAAVALAMAFIALIVAGVLPRIS
jgi:hypothetical protein